MNKAQAALKALIVSLDRVCGACMAATSQETWDLLHRNVARPCPSERSRAARLARVMMRRLVADYERRPRAIGC